MPITCTEQTVNEDGQDKKALVVSFTNGALEQLEELRDFYKLKDNLEVVKFGVSVLQKAKEAGAIKKAEDNKSNPHE